VDFLPDLPLCREASNCYSLHRSRRFSSPSGRPLVLNKLQDFFPKHNYGKIAATIRTGIHKASIAIQIQPSGRQSSWSGCTSIKYGNYVHQITRLDDQPPGPDARSLYMKITCSGRATVQKTRQHRSDAALKQERFSAKFFEFRSHSCPSEQPMTTVRTVPSFIKPDAHLNPQPINRGPLS
jgi:hypothetical protein